jgi:hypothetical protein
MSTCFVIQPFDKGPYDKRYFEVLEPAINEAGLKPYRVDQDPSVSVPIEDIENGIRSATACLADITTNNPNIWYEVGYARSCDKPVVLICADPRPEPYPFDVRHRHVISYKTDSAGDFTKLRQEVTARLAAQVKKAGDRREVVSDVADATRQIAKKEPHQAEAKPEARQVGAVVYYYHGEKGPFCQVCFDKNDGKLVLLPQAQEWNGGLRRICAVCGNRFYERPMDNSPRQTGGYSPWS